MNKTALHQHDRGAERLNLSRESVDSLQRAVDRMWYGGGHAKLKDNNYHLHIRDPHKNLLGYAALKRINATGRRPRLILASILSKNMTPRGSNISNFVNTDIKDNTVKIHTPEKFKGFEPTPNNIDRN